MEAYIATNHVVFVALLGHAQEGVEVLRGTKTRVQGILMVK